MNRRFDLHLHTKGSDGILSAEDVIRLAAEAGLWCAAVTDHDTAEAVDDAQEAGRTYGLPVIAGAEFSAEYEGEMHILGYGIDIHSAGYDAFIAEQQRRRVERNDRMLQRLGELGIVLPAEYLPEQVEGTYGRTHMARGIVAAEKAANVGQAFERYLNRGAVAYIARQKFTARELLTAIADCGGRAVLAHPGRMGLEQHGVRALVRELVDLGMAGIEAFYPTHTGEEVALLTALGKELGLVCTYGSDWHGYGAGIAARFEQFCIPESTYQWIEELLREKAR